MTVEEQLAGLCADAVGRVADLPALDAVMEDSGRQRLAAYYLSPSRSACIRSAPSRARAPG